MDVETFAVSEPEALLENIAAELSDAAYQVALHRGVGVKWIDLELDLWRALTHAIRDRPNFNRLDLA